jgi:SanA protein
MGVLRWAVLGLSAAAGAVAMNLWIDRQARGACVRDVASVPRRAVAIVPGARVLPDGRPSIALEDRLLAALELYRAGRVDAILVSGNRRAPEHDEPAAMRRWLVARGVAGEQVIEDPAGLRTLDTMQRAAQVYGVRGAVVCTQEFHLHRAVFLAQRAGIDAVGVRADRRSYRNLGRNKRREFLAKVRAFVDSYVLRAGGLRR